MELLSTNTYLQARHDSARLYIDNIFNRSIRERYIDRLDQLVKYINEKHAEEVLYKLQSESKYNWLIDSFDYTIKIVFECAVEEVQHASIEDYAFQELKYKMGNGISHSKYNKQRKKHG